MWWPDMFQQQFEVFTGFRKSAMGHQFQDLEVSKACYCRYISLALAVFIKYMICMGRGFCMSIRWREIQKAFDVIDPSPNSCCENLVSKAMKWQSHLAMGNPYLSWGSARKSYLWASHCQIRLYHDQVPQKKKTPRLSRRLRKGNAIHAGDLQGKMFLKRSGTAVPTEIWSSGWNWPPSSFSLCGFFEKKYLRMSTVIIDSLPWSPLITQQMHLWTYDPMGVFLAQIEISVRCGSVHHT